MDRVSGKCPLCEGTYLDTYDHARKKHRDYFWTPELASLIGVVACECGTLCKSSKGLQKHRHGQKTCLNLQRSGNVEVNSSQPSAVITPPLNPAPTPNLPKGPPRLAAGRRSCTDTLECDSSNLVSHHAISSRTYFDP